MPQGDNAANHMDKLPRELKTSRFYSRGSTTGLDGNRPSPALVPGHANFPAHPVGNRCMTVREAAATTGFPNGYKITGSYAKRCEQVGKF